MFTDVVTVFNFHKATGKWYPTVFKDVELQVDTASDVVTPGKTNNSDIATLLINTKRDKSVGSKTYLGPKAFAQCPDPEAHFTFLSERDFFIEGEWPNLEPVLDEDYDSGFYHEVNEAHDGVYAVKSAAFLGLIPHFEIGGR